MDSTLSSVVSSAVPRLSAITEDAAARKPAPNKWSTKEILGHLVDSAANNHQRFVRLQLEPEIRLPGYEQDGWVRVSRWQHTPWTEIIALWTAYNRHLAVALMAMALVGFGISVGNVAVNMLLQSNAPEHLRGRVVSFFSSTRFGFDAQEGVVVVRYDAALARAGGAAVSTRRFEAREPADGTASSVAPAINAAANRVAMEVAQWVGAQ